MNIRYIENLNSNNSGVSAFKLNLNRSNNDISKHIEKVENVDLFFKVGDKVKHKLENILGSITFICDDYISIKWNDNSKEKFTKEEMNKYIELNDLEQEASENIVEEESKIDIEKLQLQRKVDQMEKKNKDKLVDKVKSKAASEIVELAISKGMIDNDDREIELQTLSMMNDEEYEEYCQNVIEFTNEHQVTSRVEDRDDRTEAEKMLDRIKGTGGIIGDFSGSNVSTSYEPLSASSNESRKLSDLNNSKIKFENKMVIPSFEDQFSNILSKELNKPHTKQASAQHESSLVGFENLQGLTKPIQIQSSGNSSKLDYNSFFSSLDWSINK